MGAAPGDAGARRNGQRVRSRQPQREPALQHALPAVLKNTKWVTNAASEAGAQKFRQRVALFKRYGEQYDFPRLNDHRLVPRLMKRWG